MKLTDPQLPAVPESAYDRSLQQALMPLLRAIAVKVNQMSDGLLAGSDNGRTAPPTTGSWQAGDRITNTAPAELGAAGSKYVIQGWMCITSGTPGTWVQQRFLTGS